MKGLKILFKIGIVVCSYLIIVYFIFWVTGAKPYNENKTVRPYYGEIEQAENDFTNSEIDKLYDK